MYGAGQLVFPRKGVKINVDTISGDDTGYIHVPPYNTLDIVGTSEYKRINITWAPFVYEDATMILPNGTVEFRKAESLSYPSLTRSSQVQFRGRVVGDRAHLMVGYGGTVAFERSSPHYLKFVGVTVQKTGRLLLKSAPANQSDVWVVEVVKDVGAVYRDGVVTVEGDGLFEARSLNLMAVSLVVDPAGRLSLDGQGYTGGVYIFEIVTETMETFNVLATKTVHVINL